MHIHTMSPILPLLFPFAFNALAITSLFPVPFPWLISTHLWTDLVIWIRSLGPICHTTHVHRPLPMPNSVVCTEWPFWNVIWNVNNLAWTLVVNSTAMYTHRPKHIVLLVFCKGTVDSTQLIIDKTIIRQCMRLQIWCCEETYTSLKCNYCCLPEIVTLGTPMQGCILLTSWTISQHQRPIHVHSQWHSAYQGNTRHK